MTTPDLAALLKIAEAATPGPWVVGEPDQHGQAVVRDKDIERFTCWHHSVGAIEKEMHANAAHIAAFNPTVAQALVKVAMAAEKIATDKVSNEDGWTDEYVVLWNTLHDQLEALTAALKGSNHG